MNARKPDLRLSEFPALWPYRPSTIPSDPIVLILLIVLVLSGFERRRIEND